MYNKNVVRNECSKNNFKGEKMKKIVEKKVEENQIVKEIIKLAEETRAWIFLSNGLVAKLEKNYEYQDYVSGQGWIFIIDETVGKKLAIDLGHIWNEVSIIPKEDVYIASDPDVIYFLS